MTDGPAESPPTGMCDHENRSFLLQENVQG